MGPRRPPSGRQRIESHRAKPAASLLVAPSLTPSSLFSTPSGGFFPLVFLANCPSVATASPEVTSAALGKQKQDLSIIRSVPLQGRVYIVPATWLGIARTGSWSFSGAWITTTRSSFADFA